MALHTDKPRKRVSPAHKIMGMNIEVARSGGWIKPDANWDVIDFGTVRAARSGSPHPPVEVGIIYGPAFHFKGADLSRLAASTAAPRLPEDEDQLAASLAETASHIGVIPGEVIPRADSEAILERVARSATDIFSTAAEARKFLEQSGIGRSGLTARQLIEQGRVISVLARLDELRFGVVD